MLDLFQLCKDHGIQPHGVIHVGAHEGHEIWSYQAMGVQHSLLIEANPAVYQRLVANVGALPQVKTVNCAVSDQNGTTLLHVMSFDQSSSILAPKRHNEIYPFVTEVGQVEVPVRTLDSLLQEHNLDPSHYNFLNIDIQGAELLAFKGAASTLHHIDAINTEVNFDELYEGCALVDEIDAFLGMYGFRRVKTVAPFHPSWGDAFYVKQP